MSGIEDAISKVAAYAADDSHGYELGSRDYSFGTDCSGLARMYAAYVEGVSPTRYPDMSTRTMRATMTSRGWKAIAFSGTGSLRRGDVLLTNTNGHTVIWLGSGRVLGAEGDWDGREGDSGGREVCERAYYDYDWQWVLHWPGSGSSGSSSGGSGGRLAEDGRWGSDTTREGQEQAGTVADGVVDGQDASWRGHLAACTSGWRWCSGAGVAGSPFIKAVQRALRDRYGQDVGDIDGIAGRKFWRALEGAAGYVPDEVGLEDPSNSVRWLQRRLNAGDFF